MAQPQVEGKWEGGGKDSRLYWKVRGEKQREIRARYDRLKPFLNERSRRLWAGNESLAFGRGGVRAVAEALGMSAQRVIEGRRELERGACEPASGKKERQRRTGGGRKRWVDHQPEVMQAIEQIVDPATRGDSHGTAEVEFEKPAQDQPGIKAAGMVGEREDHQPNSV